jgi:SMC interacting uncharacterized protein involved in chromosome segregation
MKTFTKLTTIALLFGISMSANANDLTTDVTAELSNVISTAISNSINNSIEELKMTTFESVTSSLNTAFEQPTKEQTAAVTQEAPNHGK